jgi:hypothetical protein
MYEFSAMQIYRRNQQAVRAEHYTRGTKGNRGSLGAINCKWDISGQNDSGSMAKKNRRSFE